VKTPLNWTYPPVAIKIIEKFNNKHDTQEFFQACTNGAILQEYFTPTNTKKLQPWQRALLKNNYFIFPQKFTYISQNVNIRGRV
jgi:hypothetical protein